MLFLHILPTIIKLQIVGKALDANQLLYVVVEILVVGVFNQLILVKIDSLITLGIYCIEPDRR